MRKAIRNFSSSLVLLLGLTTTAICQSGRNVIAENQEDLSGQLNQILKDGDIRNLLGIEEEKITELPEEELFQIQQTLENTVLRFDDKGNAIVQTRSGDEVSKPDIKSFVSVNLQVFQGPSGEMYVPPELGVVADGVGNDAHGFISIIFQISLAPFIEEINIKDSHPKAGYIINKPKLQERNPEWVSVTVELEPRLSDDENHVEGSGESCAEYFQVLEILPNDTEAGTKEQFITQFASIASQIAGLQGPFFPVSAFQARFSSGSAGLGILLKNLFPPRSIAYQYAFMDSPSSFGWYMRRNQKDPDSRNLSLLGLHRGVVLLRVNNDSCNGKVLKGINVNYQVLSKWDKAANNVRNNKWHFIAGDSSDIVVPQKTEEASTEDDSLDLTEHPALIKVDKARDILQIKETDFDSLINNDHIQKIDGNTVTRVSMQCFLGLIAQTDCPTIKNQRH